MHMIYSSKHTVQRLLRDRPLENLERKKENNAIYVTSLQATEKKTSCQDE